MNLGQLIKKLQSIKKEIGSHPGIDGSVSFWLDEERLQLESIDLPEVKIKVIKDTLTDSDWSGERLVHFIMPNGKLVKEKDVACEFENAAAAERMLVALEKAGILKIVYKKA